MNEPEADRGQPRSTFVVDLVRLAIFVCLIAAAMVGVLSFRDSTSTPSSSNQAPAPKLANVTDLSVPFAGSESDALVARGFLGNAAFGRLDIGCTVEVIKTTDRAAQVKLVSCPPSPNTTVPVPIGTQGWVAKSALDLKP